MCGNDCLDNVRLKYECQGDESNKNGGLDLVMSVCEPQWEKKCFSGMN